MYNIIVEKRDGRKKKFIFDRIGAAVTKAYQDVYSELELYDDIYDIDTELDSVLSTLLDKFTKYESGTSLTVDEIQDIVIETLQQVNVIVADSYSKYRAHRTLVRDSKSVLMKSIHGLIDMTNDDVVKENANKQSHLASTQRDLIAGEVSKAIARTVIPPHILQAHDMGLMKVHDLDYFAQPLTNCELVDIEDMLQNGTVINKKRIRKPRSLRTAVTLVTQIAAQVSSSTYGGQTISLSHLAPFVRTSKNKIVNKYRDMVLPLSRERIDELIEEELRAEIKDAVQTFNYQILTIMSTNGQAPFISVCMYISENPEYEEETVMLIEEFLRQRIDGIENEFGINSTQTFPKLLYFLDENNIHEDSKYFWLTQLAVKSTILRMNPDYISVKKMKELFGHAFPPMGCRAFLSLFKDKNGDFKFYGRGNLGVQSINLPYVALLSGGDITRFWNELDKALELAREMCEIRYEKLRGVKASVAPIMWQHGAISRLKHDEDVLKAVDEKGFTVTIGYSGIYETVKYLTGEGHSEPVGFVLAKKIMEYMENRCEEFKRKQPHLRIALYGTPQESTTGWFSNKLKERFGEIKDITDKGWITNSYHIDIRQPIDAFHKLSLESELQNHSKGGAVSYIETCNMSKNPEAMMEIVRHMYDTIMYAEINFESDSCGKCGFQGVMDNNTETLDWVCPQCGNDDQMTLSVVRRTCGYLGETVWTDGRKLDIINRVKHI